MLVTKATQRRFSMNLAALPSCIPTQAAVVLFNLGLYCPLLDIRVGRFTGVTSPILISKRMVALDDLETWIRREPEMARGRLVSILFGAFSVLALVLAAVGLYSVVSYSVVQRTNEFGIRMALGARKKDVLWNVLASAGVSVGSGLLAGLVLSLGLNRLIARWVENSAHDPSLILGVSCVLLAVAGVACLLPSWRASSVDPMTALRSE